MIFFKTNKMAERLNAPNLNTNENALEEAKLLEKKQTKHPIAIYY